MIRSLPPGIVQVDREPIPIAKLMSVLQPQPIRGADLLLAHCAPVVEGRQSAISRLEDKLGGRLAHLLVKALVGPQGRRGSSSP